MNSKPQVYYEDIQRVIKQKPQQWRIGQAVINWLLPDGFICPQVFYAEDTCFWEEVHTYLEVIYISTTKD